MKMDWSKDNSSKTWKIDSEFATVVVWATDDGYSWKVDCVRRASGHNTTLYRAKSAAVSAVVKMADEVYDSLKDWIDME